MSDTRQPRLRLTGQSSSTPTLRERRFTPFVAAPPFPDSADSQSFLFGSCLLTYSVGHFNLKPKYLMAQAEPVA